MKNDQLKELFGSLNKNEVKEFCKFIRSPFFNNRSEVVRYFDALKKFYPEFDPIKLNEEKIFKQVYPGKKFNGALMRKLLSLTTSLLVDFYAITASMENDLEYNVKLFEKLYAKKLFTVIEKKKKAVDELFSSSERSFPYYDAKYKYTTFINGYFMNLSERSMLSSLQNEIDDFIEYFLSVSLLMYIRLGEWEKGFKKKYDLKFYNEVMKYLLLNSSGEVTLSTLYYNMLMLLETEDEKYFFKLQECREIFSDKLHFSDDYNIGVVSIQYCYKRIQKGDIEFRKHQFELTKNILKKDLIPKGFLDLYFFTNAVRTAVTIKEFIWSENFIKEYKSRLNSDVKNEVSEYSYAMLEFGKEDFSKSLSHLSRINPEASYIKMDIKNLFLMNYYELGYTEELISLIDNYKHFLHREKDMSEQIKKANSAFVNLVAELLKVRLKGKKGSAEELKKEIENTPYFTAKEWLLKKINEIK